MLRSVVLVAALAACSVGCREDRPNATVDAAPSREAPKKASARLHGMWKLQDPESVLAAIGEEPNAELRPRLASMRWEFDGQKMATYVEHKLTWEDGYRVDNDVESSCVVVRQDGVTQKIELTDDGRLTMDNVPRFGRAVLVRAP